MNVTQKLMQEHQLILRYIAFIERLANSWEPGVKDSEHYAALKTVVEFIKNYADRYHHAKEEDILFRHLEVPGVLTHCNPIPVMLYDHEEGRAMTAGLLDSITTKSRDRALSYALGWCEHLTGHIYKEDNVLYPMAEEGLPEEEKQTILREYELAEEQQKAGLTDHYTQLLLELENQLAVAV